MRDAVGGKNPELGRFLLLGLLVFAVYSPSLDNGFIYDDTQVVVIQDAPTSWADAARVFGERHFYNLPYYRPLTRLSLLLQKTLHGNDPLWFHAFNIAALVAAAMLAYAVLRLPVFGLSRTMAWCAALLFAVHPAASSCVYPVSSGRESLMPVVWILGLLLAWLSNRTLPAYACFAAALLSKESAVVAPVVILAADIWLRGPRTTIRWTRYAPFALLLGGYFALRFLLFGGGEYAPGSLTAAVQSFGYALQSIIVPYIGLRYEPEWDTWLSWPRLGLALALTGGLIWAARRHASRPVWFWTAWFTVLLLPTANLIRQEAKFDERYVWPASLALFAVAAVVASRTRWGTPAAASLAVALSLVSVGRDAAFANDLAFSQQWIRTSPGNVNAHFNSGFALQRASRFDEAAQAYRAALRIRPDYALAHNNLADALMKAGRPAESGPHLREALRLDPSLAEAHYNLGLLQVEAGDAEQASLSFAQAVRLKPDSPEAHMNLANTLAVLGRIDEAIAHYGRALALRPGYPDAQRNLEVARILRDGAAQSAPAVSSPVSPIRKD
ncbi:MAG: tetratricopeptide repeat protein [Bryobacterales bacterium]|nr:tetratricopeptide repeat protein [Bryobacterales bacterium]